MAEAAPLKHLYLVDGSGFIFRAFHAIRPLSRPDGTPVNAVFGFTRMLMKLLRDTEADHIAVIFDAAPERFGGQPMDYLTAVWARDVTLANRETLDVNGMSAATGTVRIAQQGQEADLRLVAIRKDETIYRFLFVSPPQLTATLSPGFQRTLYSFRDLNREERRSLRPRYLEVETAEQNASSDRLSRALPYADAREERFRVLNGLAPGQDVPRGSLFKTVIER